MKILTVIVPTYNMEKYLDKCLTSLIVSDQSLMDQLEVLVVNDGSKDRSSEIAHGYESRYPNTFRVIDKQNGNYGSCINAALPVATGKYVKVLDADDWFENANFEYYLTELSNAEVDLIITKSVSFLEETKIFRDYGYHIHVTTKEELSFEELFQIGNLAFSIRMHNITYRTENLKLINYTQTEGLSYTDNEWNFFPMLSVSSVLLLPIVVYNYTIGRLGQTVSKEQLRKHFKDETLVSLNLCDLYLVNKDKYKNVNVLYLEEYLKCHIQNLYLYEYSDFKYPVKEFKHFDITLKKKYPNIFNLIRDIIFIDNVSIEKMSRYFYFYYIFYLYRMLKVKLGTYRNALMAICYNRAKK